MLIKHESFSVSWGQTLEMSNPNCFNKTKSCLTCIFYISQFTLLLNSSVSVEKCLVSGFVGLGYSSFTTLTDSAAVDLLKWALEWLPLLLAVTSYVSYYNALTFSDLVTRFLSERIQLFLCVVIFHLKDSTQCAFDRTQSLYLVIKIANVL